MSILKSPPPEAPGPKDEYSPNREAGNAAYILEVGRTLAAVIEVLSRYTPTRITDALGKIYNVLAKDAGEEPVPTSTAALCELEVFNATNPESPETIEIGVRWGRVNRRVPTGLTTSVAKVFHSVSLPTFIYAKVTFSSTTFLPTDIALIEDDTVLDNTATIGYAVLASVFMSGDEVVIGGGCGPVEISYCDLALE
jgi:hypothetical protein